MQNPQQHVVGLAFTSPTAIVPALDKDQFNICLYEGVPSSLKDLVAPSEDAPARRRVVLVPSLAEYIQIKDTVGIHAFLIFDDPATLNHVEGLNIFDCTRNAVDQGWRRIKFKAHQLNALLGSDAPELKLTIPRIEPLLKKLKKSACFKQLIGRAVEPLEKDGQKKAANAACLYATGQAAKRTWTSKVVKPIRTVAKSMESLIELERFVENSKECDALWRAFFDHAEQGVELEEAAAKYKHCNLSDLQYICTLISAEKGLKYVHNPADSPYAS